MIRQSKIASELMRFENQKPYLEIQNPRMKMQVISSNTIKIGRKIKLSPEDIIIIVFLKRNGEYVISISRYMKFGITKEVYFNVTKKISSLNNIEGSNFISASIKSLDKLKE
jgi:hypothetical protein